jgi:hypothetical protein
MKDRLKITMRSWDSISDHDKGWSFYMDEDEFVRNQEEIMAKLQGAAKTMTREQFFDWYVMSGYNVLEKDEGMTVEWVDD